MILTLITKKSSDTTPTLRSKINTNLKKHFDGKLYTR